MKKLLLISFILIIVLVISCGKKEEASINNNSMYVSNTDNIYHKTYTNVVKIQGKYVNINSTFYYGNRKEGEYSEDYDIFEAIKNHSLKRVIELIEKGNNINQIHNSNSIYNEFTDYTYPVENAIPLMFAVFYRDLGIMKYLLDNGADPHIKDNNGLNSFLWACGVGNVDVIKMLVQADPDLVNSQNMYGDNGLYVAVLNENVEVFEYLVNDLGIDINSIDEFLYNARKDAIEKLKELGAK